jgi:hypothetical protein
VGQDPWRCSVAIGHQSMTMCGVFKSCVHEILNHLKNDYQRINNLLRGGHCLVKGGKVTGKVTLCAGHRLFQSDPS